MLVGITPNSAILHIGYLGWQRRVGIVSELYDYDRRIEAGLLNLKSIDEKNVW